jgi:AcrR family transcriptional regulator
VSSPAPSAPDARTRILEQATRLFAAQGYAGTSIQEVAAAAGVTRPTLVYHFGSKDQLRASVLEQMLDHWREELPRVLAAATSGGDRFQGSLDAVVAFFRADPDRARLLVREMLDRPDEMSELFTQHLQPWTALLTDYIRIGQEAGGSRREVDPEAYVLQILNAAIGTIAMGGAARHILPNAPGLDRQLSELGRIARLSLFNERPSAEAVATEPHPDHASEGA